MTAKFSVPHAFARALEDKPATAVPLRNVLQSGYFNLITQ